MYLYALFLRIDTGRKDDKVYGKSAESRMAYRGRAQTLLYIFLVSDGKLHLPLISLWAATESYLYI
jgi:hypothetical protein